MPPEELNFNRKPASRQQRTSYPQDSHENESFRKISRLVGYVGLLLPILLIICSALKEGDIQPSISHYHFTVLQPLFSGVLGLWAALLFSYSTSNILEKLNLNAIAFLALVIAFVPTKYDNSPFNSETQYSVGFLNNSFHRPVLGPPESISNVHFISAFFFFSLLCVYVYYFIYLPEHQLAQPDRTKEKIFKISFILMVASMIVLILGLFYKCPFTRLTFSCEAAALLFFGGLWVYRSYR